ncbi:MAG TPA: redoxin domain-containing protein, partial [Blastocatellia bacterium]
MKNIARFCLLLIVGVMLVGFSLAQETFKNPALEQDSEFERAFARARALAREGKTEEAIKEFKKAADLKNGQCADCFRFIGQVYFRAAKYKEAATAFRQALALKTDKEADTCNALGVALYQQNDKKLYEEAATAFRRAIELSNDQMPRVHYNLGYTLIKMDRQDEGVAELKKYLEIAPSASDAPQVRAVIANPRLAFETLPVEFRVKSIAGDELSLEKFRGKVVLLDFWATWCGPCMFEMPEVKRIWKKYSASEFIIIGISLDSNERALRS